MTQLKTTSALIAHLIASILHRLRTLHGKHARSDWEQRHALRLDQMRLIYKVQAR
jgi:hypothetical protein